MSIVTDRKDLDTTIGADGMQRNYLVLSDEERQKGFVRPVRTSYQHVGSKGPSHPLRDLTEDEKARYSKYGYVKFEDSPNGAVLGRYWTQPDLDAINRGCGTVTTMGISIAETYAKEPNFYSGTFCVGCKTHRPVGEDGEFIWLDGTRVGT